MNAQLTLSQVYYNSSLLNFFFRTQSQNTFEELIDLSEDKENTLDTIEAQIDELDEFEELCYNEDINYLVDYFGLDIIVDDNEE